MSTIIVALFPTIVAFLFQGNALLTFGICTFVLASAANGSDPMLVIVLWLVAWITALVRPISNS